MLVLSFDTSTTSLHLALMRDREVIDSRVVPPSSANRQEVGSALLPAIDEMLKQAGVSKRDLELVVVGTGPGSFTGIRVGVITARSIAQFLDLPLIGISNLEVFAFEARRSVAVILGAGKNHYFAGAYRADGGNPALAVIEPIYLPEEELLNRFNDLPTWLVDDKARSDLPDRACESLPTIKNIAVSQAQLAYDRLSFVGMAPGLPEQDDSHQRLEQFKWWKVLPLYLRNPSVTLKKSDGNSDKAAINK